MKYAATFSTIRSYWRWETVTEQKAMEMLDSFYEMDEMYAAAQIAIKALEEVQQYREIGTVEECRA